LSVEWLILGSSIIGKSKEEFMTNALVVPTDVTGDAPEQNLTQQILTGVDRWLTSRLGCLGFLVSERLVRGSRQENVPK
jgi:hypothetical protein